MHNDPSLLEWLQIRRKNLCVLSPGLDLEQGLRKGEFTLPTLSPAPDLSQQGLEFCLPNLVHPLTLRGAGPCGSCLQFEVSEAQRSVESGLSPQSQAHEAEQQGPTASF